jgi:hypothetical protein
MAISELQQTQVPDGWPFHSPPCYTCRMRTHSTTSWDRLRFLRLKLGRDSQAVWRDALHQQSSAFLKTAAKNHRLSRWAQMFFRRFLSVSTLDFRMCQPLHYRRYGNPRTSCSHQEYRAQSESSAYPSQRCWKRGRMRRRRCGSFKFAVCAMSWLP